MSPPSSKQYAARHLAQISGVLVLTGVIIVCPSVKVARADEVDDSIAALMRDRNIQGLSLAIINGGKILRAKGYGFTDKSHGQPVTSLTLFQAGSISKSVAALGALRLVEEGQIDLDADINTRLHSWKIPENEFTRDEKVTLRRILCHSSGLTVHGFNGYAVTSPIPTLVEMLDGVKPANSSPIRVDMVPGSKWRYSGGGYVVMQQLLLDVTGKSFPAFMCEKALKPLGMCNSTYEQPLPKGMAPSAASGFYSDGKAVDGQWHIYPEMAAAGLWTTASDLARFAISLQQSFAGISNPVLSQSMVRKMLTKQKEDDGLGVFLTGKEESLRFWHNGRDDGFDAYMIACGHSGQGAVILINKNDNSGAVDTILELIAKKYGWP